MKKQHILQLIIWLFPVVVMSQEVAFTYIEDRTNTNIPLGVEESADGFAILSQQSSSGTPINYRLVKISLQGGFVKETLILPEGVQEIPEHFKVMGITQSHADTIYVLGSLPAEDDDTYDLFMACYNSDLQLLHTYRMPTSYYGVPKYGRAKMNRKGNILFFGGMRFVKNNPSKTMSFICEITPQGIIKQLKLFKLYNTKELTFSSLYDYKVYDVVEKPNNNGYIVINESPLDEFYDLRRVVPFVELDMSLNVLSYKIFRDGYIAGTAFFDTDSTYICAGNSLLSYKSSENKQEKNLFPYYLGVMKYDTAHHKLKKVRFGSDEYESYSGMYGNTSRDKVFPEYFYYSGTVNSIGTIIGMHNASSHILVNKLDMDLNLKWQKTIGEDDDAYYLNYAAHATNDGGVLLLNHVYHYGSSSINLHVVKLKGSGDGIEENNTKQTSYHVYPNPGSDWLKVNIPKAHEETILQFTLHTLAGKTVYHENIQGNTPVNVSHLKDGMYIYTIRRNNTVLKSGKWVKN